MAILNSTIINGDLKVLNQLTANAPTQATSDNSTQIATTAYVKNNLSNYLPLSGGATNLLTGDIYSGKTDDWFRIQGTSAAGNGARLALGPSTLSGADAGTFWLVASKSSSENAILKGLPNGTLTWSGPVPALGTNDTQIATTAFVYQNAARILNADTTIFVAYDGTGDGTTAAKAMSINDMWKYLASVRMEDASGAITNPKRLTIKFVPRASSASYGNLGLYSSKMPGVRFLTIDTSTGTAGTTSNYTTNCPYFGTITVTGPINVTIQNVQMTSGLTCEFGSTVTLQTYIGGTYFSTNNYARLTFGNGTYNIHNANTSYLIRSYDYGYTSINTATAIFNFRELCRYTGSIFRAESFGFYKCFWYFNWYLFYCCWDCC